MSPEAHIAEPEKSLCKCGHPRASLPLGNPLQLGLNDNTHALKIKGILLLTDPWAVQRAEQQRWHSFVQILGTTAAVPLWSRLALFNSQLGCPTFFVVNFCWVLPASVVQGRLHNLEKLGQGRTSQRLPLSVFFRARQHLLAHHCLHSWAGAARACEITDVRQYERARRTCVAYESCFILGENDWSKYSKNL